MIRSKSFVTMLGLAASLVAPLAAAEAKTIRDKALGYEVTFPGDPEPAELREDMPDFVRRISGWEQQDATGFFVVYGAQILGDDEAFPDARAAVQDAYEQCSLGGEVQDEITVPFTGGAVGIEVLSKRTLPLGDGVLMELVRVAVTRNRIFCVRSSYSEGEDPKLARAFVRSLTLQ